MDAISNAATIAAGKARWTITNVFDQRNTSRPFLFGKLSKFSDEGHVKLVDTKRRSEVDAIAENLLIASANFVYLPQYSGLAYMHVWNHIEADTFARRFKEIIEATYDNFFVGCCVEAISDYRSFGVKLRGLDRIHELSARVHPPNPLFGRLWGSLNDYVAQRNASEVSVRETQDSRNGLVSKISELVSRILENPEYQPEFDVAIGDAAILMAADGYGSGRVVGEQDGEEVTIRTSDAQKTFLFSKEPKPADLADEAEKHFQRTSAERDMRHP
ncbi:hypothetical protein [Burkholderia multivorans]|nr:hypothetical protein [Burkholderia multivorans]